MYNNILVALSLEHGISAQALNAARALVSDGGMITAAHVHEPPNSSILLYLDEETVKKSRQEAKEKLIARTKDEKGVTPVLLEGQSAGRTIVEYANTHGADCIVIASHLPGAKEFFLGSTASLVVRHAHCSVHVLRV
nr:universal stress protein [Ruegeria sp. HKCCA6837]